MILLIKRILIIFGSLLFLTILGIFGVCGVFFLGPSISARDRLALSCFETSAMKWVPGMFLKGGLVAQIKASNSVIDTADITDTSLFSFGEHISIEEDDEWADYPDGIRIEIVRGPTYRGHVMLVRDPSRVYTGISSDFKTGAPGIKIQEMTRREGAIAGINGGGFEDDGGVSLGDTPIGLVMSKGQMVWGNEGVTYSTVMGFTHDNVFVLGNMTPKMARDIGMRDGLCFGPILVMNGEPSQFRGIGSGLNPRSAIGQRADGTVILVVVEGRMSSSLGASYADLVEIMVKYKAVNAGNLDGGTSTALMYKDELVNIHSSLYGPRRIPTYFLVRP